jgi:hypothetical protein
LKRFNKKMLKLEELIELVTSKALINGVREHSLWKDLYALPDRSLLKVKVIENHMWVEKTIILRHESPHFY